MVAARPLRLLAFGKLRLGDVPVAERLIEHNSHLGDGPVAERLVEHLSIAEHGLHGGHLGDGSVAERLVERLSISEHGGHLGDVPVVERLLNACAFLNMDFIVVTWETLQLPSGWLNALTFSNI